MKEFIMHSRHDGDLLIYLWMQTKWAPFCWLEYTRMHASMCSLNQATLPSYIYYLATLSATLYILNQPPYD